MKKSLLVFILLLCRFFAFGQEKPRLILPVGHTGFITSGSFSPDGKWLLSSSYDRTARLFDVESGKELQILYGHTKNVLSADFSPDGRLALTTSDDNTARIFDLATGKQLHAFSNNPTIGRKSAIFSPDGKKALILKSNKASLFDVTSGNLLQVFQHDYDLSGGEYDGDGNVFYKTPDIILSATFSPNGKQLITMGSGGLLLKVWELEYGQCKWKVERFFEKFSTATFSPDSKKVLTAKASKHEVEMYESATGKKLDSLRLSDVDGNWNCSAVFSPDEKRVIFSENDIAQLYELPSGNFIRGFKYKDKIQSSVFNANGQLAMTISGKTVRIWDLASGKERHTINQEFSVNSAHFSPDGKRILVIDDSQYDAVEIGSLSVFDVESGKMLQKISNRKYSLGTGDFSADGKLALTCLDSTIQVWEIASGKTLQFFKTDNKVISAQFSKNGKVVQSNGKEYGVAWILGNPESIVERWQSGYQTGSRNFTNSGFLMPGLILSGWESPDGKQLLTFDDSTACLREKETGIALQVFHHDNPVFSAVLSPDGLQAITTCNDSISRLWDVEFGKLQKVFHHENRVGSAIFSPDGKLFLAVMGDYYNGSYAELIEVSTGKRLQQMRFEGNLNSAVFSPDGKIILFTCTDHRTILWNVPAGKPYFTRLQLKENEWLLYDEHKRFDGSPNTLKKLYFVCGFQIKSQNKLTDCLRVPDLAGKIIRQEEIMVKNRLVPRLEDLKLCDNAAPTQNKEK